MPTLAGLQEFDARKKGIGIIFIRPYSPGDIPAGAAETVGVGDGVTLKRKPKTIQGVVERETENGCYEVRVRGFEGEAILDADCEGIAIDDLVTVSAAQIHGCSKSWP
jgi:hypothetical protein